MEVQNPTQGPTANGLFKQAVGRMEYFRRPDSEKFECVSNVEIRWRVIVVHGEHVASTIITAGAIVLGGRIVIGSGIQFFASTILCFKYEGVAETMAQAGKHS